VKISSNIKIVSMLLIFLIISTSFCFAAEMSLTYDANGNLITGDGKYRTYNSLNQLWRVYNGSNTSMLLEEYTYDPIEERVLIKKSYNTSGAWIETVVYVDKTFVQIKNLSGIYNTTYIYQDGTLVAQINPDGSKYFIHSDSKNSNTVITNSTGQIIDNSSYTPFGEILTSGNKSRYSYESKEFDSVVKDTDFNARKYDPTRGQFNQPDTLIQNVYDPQDLNRYSFEHNNPYKTTDPTGHYGESEEDAGNWWGPVTIALIAKHGRRFAARLGKISDLYSENAKERGLYTRGTCVNCNNDDPSPDTLIYNDLRKNMDIILEKGKVVGYYYKNKYVPNLDTFEEYGFNQDEVQKVSDEIENRYDRRGVADHGVTPGNAEQKGYDANTKNGCTATYNPKTGGYSYKC